MWLAARWLPAANLACRQGTAAMACPTSWGVRHEQAAPRRVQCADSLLVGHEACQATSQVVSGGSRCCLLVQRVHRQRPPKPACGAEPCIVQLLQCCLVSAPCRKVAEYQQSCAARVSRQLQRSRLGRLATVLQAWAAVAEDCHADRQRMLHVVLRISLLKVSAAFTQWRELTAETAGQHAWAWQLHPLSFTESCLQQLYIVQDLCTSQHPPSSRAVLLLTFCAQMT